MLHPTPDERLMRDPKLFMQESLDSVDKDHSKTATSNTTSSATETLGDCDAQKPRIRMQESELSVTR